MIIKCADKYISLSEVEIQWIPGKSRPWVKDGHVIVGNEQLLFEVYDDGDFFIKGLLKILETNPLEDTIYSIDEIVEIGRAKINKVSKKDIDWNKIEKFINKGGDNNVDKS